MLARQKRTHAEHPIFRYSMRFSLGKLGSLACVVAAALLLFAHEAQSGQATQGSSTNGSTDGGSLQTPQAKKLFLKDGNYQLVREYQRSGDRVKYFSAERG